jgi:hypothetical protein
MLNNGLSYTTFYHIQMKEKLYLLTPLQHHNFHIDQCVVEKWKNKIKMQIGHLLFLDRKTSIIHMLLYKLSR